MPNYKIGYASRKSDCQTDTSKQLATILIQLYQDYPLFFKDVDADDHELDMDRGFKTYDEMMRNSNAG